MPAPRPVRIFHDDMMLAGLLASATGAAQGNQFQIDRDLAFLDSELNRRARSMQDAYRAKLQGGEPVATGGTANRAYTVRGTPKEPATATAAAPAAQAQPAQQPLPWHQGGEMLSTDIINQFPEAIDPTMNTRGTSFASDRSGGYGMALGPLGRQINQEQSALNDYAANGGQGNPSHQHNVAVGQRGVDSLWNQSGSFSAAGNPPQQMDPITQANLSVLQRLQGQLPPEAIQALQVLSHTLDTKQFINEVQQFMLKPDKTTPRQTYADRQTEKMAFEAQQLQAALNARGPQAQTARRQIVAEMGLAAFPGQENEMADEEISGLLAGRLGALQVLQGSGSGQSVMNAAAPAGGGQPVVIVNRATGQRMVLQNGQWVPAQ